MCLACKDIPNEYITIRPFGVEPVKRVSDMEMGKLVGRQVNGREG